MKVDGFVQLKGGVNFSAAQKAEDLTLASNWRLGLTALKHFICTDGSYGTSKEMWLKYHKGVLLNHWC